MLRRDSPNFDARPPGLAVDTIVLHATVFDTLEETCSHFENPESQVSTHYTVDRDGTVVQHVDESRSAFHAGVSRMPDGREKVNDFSIGIELVNLNDAIDPYPMEQLSALETLLHQISTRHPIANIVTHAEIAQPPGRKTDPAGLDPSQFRPKR
ncbi:MAG: N-acetylmuramoyl-L-alanine amidase [Armatimonadetes bacterium]|nr:N-acetylmuramoyl-L-alanine amidase [Armatimonadota bacterium]